MAQADRLFSLQIVAINNILLLIATMQPNQIFKNTIWIKLLLNYKESQAGLKSLKYYYEKNKIIIYYSYSAMPVI